MAAVWGRGPRGWARSMSPEQRAAPHPEECGESLPRPRFRHTARCLRIQWSRAARSLMRHIASRHDACSHEPRPRFARAMWTSVYCWLTHVTKWIRGNTELVQAQTRMLRTVNTFPVRRDSGTRLTQVLTFRCWNRVSFDMTYFKVWLPQWYWRRSLGRVILATPGSARRRLPGMRPPPRRACRRRAHRA